MYEKIGKPVSVTEPEPKLEPKPSPTAESTKPSATCLDDNFENWCKAGRPGAKYECPQCDTYLGLCPKDLKQHMLLAHKKEFSEADCKNCLNKKYSESSRVFFSVQEALECLAAESRSAAH
jgi:hypothetical protein